MLRACGPTCRSTGRWRAGAAVYSSNGFLRDETFPAVNIVIVETDGPVRWHVNLTSSGQWIGVCEALGLTAKGKSLDDLRQSVEWSIQRLMEELTSMGEFDSFLRDRGWRGMPGVGKPPQNGAQYQIPIQLVIHFGYTGGA